MAVLTGRSGQLYSGATRVARCTSWSLDEQRPMLDNTPVDTWDQTVVPGRYSATGNAKIIYDPEDAGANTLFDSILLDTKGEVGLSLILDTLTGESYPVAVHVSSASHAVAKGEAQMRDISFKVSDVGIELEIIGSTKASKNGVQFYTAAVYGLGGAWVYAWSITSGPTIANPTAPSTNINFPSTGTFLITVTATLGTTVLTDTLSVEVVDIPLMWLSRPTSPMATTQGPDAVYGATGIDTVNQHIYHAAVVRPDASLGAYRVLLSKFDYAGIRLATKAFSGLADNPGVNFIQVLADGTIFIVFTPVFNEAQMIRLSADLSTILWQFRYTSTTRWGGGVYDPVTNKVFFNFQAATEPFFVGFVEMSTGAVTKVQVTASPTRSNAGGYVTPVVTAAGTVLFGLTESVSTKLTLLEFNKDLKVGSLYQAIKVVEHQFSATDPATYNIGTMLDTGTYYAFVASNSDALGITLLNKSDLSVVNSRTFGNQGVLAYFGGGLCGAYFAEGEFVVWTSQFFNNGIGIAKIAEDLTSASTFYRIAGSSATTYSANVGFSPATGGYGSCAPNSADPALGFIATSVFSSPGQEYCVAHRTAYSGPNVMQYLSSPARWLVSDTPRNPPNSTFFRTPATLTNTFNRTYAFALDSAPTASSAVTIANETLMTFQTFVLSS